MNVYGGTKCHDRRSLEIKIQWIKLTKSFWQTKQRIYQTPILKIKEPTDRRYRFHITSSPRRSSRVFSFQFSVQRIILSPQTAARAGARRRAARARASIASAMPCCSFLSLEALALLNKRVKYQNSWRGSNKCNNYLYYEKIGFLTHLFSKANRPHTFMYTYVIVTSHEWNGDHGNGGDEI